MGVQLTGLSPTGAGSSTASTPDSPLGWERRLRRALRKVVAWDLRRAKAAAQWIGPDSHPMLQDLERLRYRLMHGARDVRRVTVWPVQGRKEGSAEASVRTARIKSVGMQISDFEAGPLSIPSLQELAADRRWAQEWKLKAAQSERGSAGPETPYGTGAAAGSGTKADSSDDASRATDSRGVKLGGTEVAHDRAPDRVAGPRAAVKHASESNGGRGDEDSDASSEHSDNSAEAELGLSQVNLNGDVIDGPAPADLRISQAGDENTAAQGAIASQPGSQ